METKPKKVTFSRETIYYPHVEWEIASENGIPAHPSLGTKVKTEPTTVSVYCIDKICRTADLELLLRFFPCIDAMVDEDDGHPIELFYNWTSEQFDAIYQMIQSYPKVHFREMKLLEICYWLDCSEELYTLFDIDAENRTPEELKRIQQIIPEEIILCNQLNHITI
jgi:hypothetical protein